MSLPDSYFDVGTALTGGYRVVYIRARSQQDQVIMDTAGDVAAAARLCQAAVLTSDPDVRIACRQWSIRLVDAEEHRRK